MRRLSHCSNLPWIIGGDFNEILLDDEKKGGVVRSQAHINQFREFVDLYRLEDLDFCGSKFTWARSEGSPLEIRERLDKFLVNSEFKELFKDCNIKHLNKHNSDHNLILASFAKTISVMESRNFKKPNRFEEA